MQLSLHASEIFCAVVSKLLLKNTASNMKVNADLGSLSETKANWVLVVRCLLFGNITELSCYVVHISREI